MQGARSKARKGANGTALSLGAIVVGFMIQAGMYMAHTTAGLRECKVAEIAEALPADRDGVIWGSAERPFQSPPRTRHEEGS